MEIEPKIHFDDTEVAFSYKSDRELKKANFIFSLVNNPFVSSIATGLAKVGLALKLPVKGLIRSTVFEHFCGGETIDQSNSTIQTLFKFNVGTIFQITQPKANTMKPVLIKQKMKFLKPLTRQRIIRPSHFVYLNLPDW